MSGIRKGTAARKAPPKPAGGAAGAGAGKKPQAAQKKASGGGGGGGAQSSRFPSAACFAGCGVSGKQEVLTAHYEKVFSTNDKPHVDALIEKLDPHFSDATHCQICGVEAAHSGLLLQHIFKEATKKAVGTNAKYNAEMHGTLFSSFVNELLTMAQVGKGEAVEYMLSLLVPDLPDSDDDDDEDDEENDLYEDDEEDDEEGSADEDELAAFEAFLEEQGIDMSSLGGPGGSPKQRMQFMQAMAAQMGMGDDDDEEEEPRPRGGKKAGGKAGAAGGAGAPKGKGAATAAGASPAGAGSKARVPAGTDKPGVIKCSSCDQMRNKDLYSSAQQKKKGQRRCKHCIDADAAGTGAGDSSKAAAGAAAGSSAAAAAKPAASKAYFVSSPLSTEANTYAGSASSSDPINTLHVQHALRHMTSAGEEIVSEDEEVDGDGLPHEESEESDEEDEEEEEDDDDDDSFDPIAAMFGGGARRQAQRAHGRRTAKAKREAMGMQLVLERPGQQLRRDRRLRLKPSKEHPVRCWLPREGDGVVCHECEWRTPSRLVAGWKLACVNCALDNEWMEDEERAHSGDEEEDEHESIVERRLSEAPRVSHHASSFPAYRAGLTRCARPACGSAKLLLVYDEKGDEYIICTACHGTRQKLRYFDKLAHRLVDSLQEPTTHD